MRLLVNNIKLPVIHNEEDIYKACADSLRVGVAAVNDLEIKHKSIDARRGDVKYIYTVEADISNGHKYINNSRIKNVSLPSSIRYQLPDKKYCGRPIIVGAGPAGLFCAYACVEAGVSPIVIERGSKVDIRKKDVDDFWNTGKLILNSNVQFGEGGAGTFSDGKLNTLVKDKNGRCSYVMQTFVKFGAPANILYDSKPHIGTDILINVVKNMREYICEHGGEFLFDTQVTGLKESEGRIKGVQISSKDGIGDIESSIVVLAIGHSARDTFEMLNEKGISMEAKSFAVGFRVEHPRQFIDDNQYGLKYKGLMPAASYKLTAQTSYDRGVYSFCMCPGGYVVNSSSEMDKLAVNGMSYSGRDGANSNSAIIVTVTPDDYPGDGVLAGICYQRHIEERAYALGKGSIPVQTYGDFQKSIGNILGNTPVASIPEEYLDGFKPQTKGSTSEADLSSIFTDEINKSFVEGMKQFGNRIKGYDSPHAFLSGVESRTSSPVRINRDDNGCSPTVSGLYPCGEGAGYAGGITSAAMDGLYIAERIITSDEQ